MKKLLIVCVFSLFFGFLSSSVFAIQYCKDFLETGNPGGLGSLKTFDDELYISAWSEQEIDIWINDVPEPLITAGFWITFDPTILWDFDIEVYDGELYPALWDPGFTGVVDQPAGPGTYMLMVGNFAHADPDGDGDILIARLSFYSEMIHTQTSVTFSTIPGFNTVGGSSDYIYDPDIISNTISICLSCNPCICYELNPQNVILTAFGLQQFTPFFSIGCDVSPPHNLQWTDTCSQGDVDQSGLFTADLITMSEQCQACVTDLANPLVECCSDISLEPLGDIDQDSILDHIDNCPKNYNPNQEDIYPPHGNGIGDACDCEGNFDCDVDCDGADAATFKVDFGRSSFNNPCEGGDLCNGDFDCDGDCDGTDAAGFKVDFGRSSFNDPCPACFVGEWCVYE